MRNTEILAPITKLNLETVIGDPYADAYQPLASFTYQPNITH